MALELRICLIAVCVVCLLGTAADAQADDDTPIGESLTGADSVDNGQTTYFRFGQNSGLGQQQEQRNEAELQEQLQSHPDLVDIFFPERRLIDKSVYHYVETTRYTMNVVFDPCRGQHYYCCNDTFGTPKFRNLVTDPTLRDFGEYEYFDQSGTRIIGTRTSSETRYPDDEYFIDPECTGMLEPRTDCVAQRTARKEFSKRPRCWNFNDTIVADASCRSPVDGSTLPTCFEVGFTQNALIVECGGKQSDNPHCGTYLEIHKPGDETIIAQAKLRKQFTSGYRMSAISTTYRGNSSRIICGSGGGQYEIWWVQRTLYDFQVQKKLPFKVESPACEFDTLNNEYLPYVSIDKIVPLSGIDEFDPQRLLYAAPVGTTGDPNIDLGPTAPGFSGRDPNVVPDPPSPPPVFQVAPTPDPLPAGCCNCRVYNNDWGGSADPSWGGEELDEAPGFPDVPVEYQN